MKYTITILALMLVAELDVTAEVTKLEPANEIPGLVTCEVLPTDELIGEIEDGAIEVAEGVEAMEVEPVALETDVEAETSRGEVSGMEVSGAEPPAVIVAVHVLTSWTIGLPLLSITGVNTIVHVSMTGPLSL